MGGQTIVITGATDGLGRAMAEELAMDGGKLILHGRNDEKGERLLTELEARAQGELVWQRADLASLAEVRELGERLLAEEQRIDVLVNNAGIGTSGSGSGREESRDGHELRFAVNYLSHYLLTRLLLDRLQSSAPARIVNVTSGGQAPIDFDDPMLERRYTGVQAYCQSKLALVMLTFDLAEELDPARVTANCLHPGTYMPTKMVREAGVRPVTRLEGGRDATLRLIRDPELAGVSGTYFDGMSESAPHPQAHDHEARRRLRELSEALTGA